MKELDYPAYPSSAGPRLEWSAIFAGTAMSLAVMACLTVLGASIGFLAAPAAGDIGDMARGLGLGGSLWVLCTGIVSFYVGGWFASRLSNAGRPADGVLYGLVTWSATTLVATFVFTSAVAGLMGSAMSVLGHAASGASQGAVQQAASGGGGDIGDRVSGIGRDIKERLQSVTGRGGGGRDEQGRGGGQGSSNQASTDRSGGGTIPSDAPENASRAAGAVGLFGFVLMACEALAAAIGGRVGARLYRPVPISRYGSRHHEREIAHH